MVPVVGLILVDEVEVPGVGWAGIFGDVGGRGFANIVPVHVGKKKLMLLEVLNTTTPQSFFGSQISLLKIN